MQVIPYYYIFQSKKGSHVREIAEVGKQTYVSYVIACQSVFESLL